MAYTPLKTTTGGGITPLKPTTAGYTPLGGGAVRTIPKTTEPIKKYETPPTTLEQKAGRIIAPLQPKEGENVGMKSLKFLGRMVIAPFKPLAEDILEIHAVNEISKGVGEGKYDPKILDEFEILKKSSPQVVGDVAQAVIAVTPLRALNAIKGLPILSKIALTTLAKTGAQVGAGFGVAEKLSERPEVKPTELATGAITGAIGGAIAMPAFGIGTKAISAGIGKVLGRGISKIAPVVQKALPEAIPTEKGIPQELQPLAQEALPIHLNRPTIEAMTKAYKKGSPIIMNRPIALVKENGKISVLEGEHRLYSAKQAGVEPPMVLLTRKATDGLNASQIDALARKTYTGKNTPELADFYTQAVKGVKEVKPVIPQPTGIERIFPKLYEKRLVKQGLLDPEDIVEPPKMGIIRDLISSISPVRTSLQKDPTASFIGMRVRNITQQQNNAYKGLFDNNWEIIKKLPKDVFSKIVGLQEKGIETTKAPIELKAGLTALRNLEQKAFDLSKQAGADVSQWRFTPKNHFSHLWTGEQVITDNANKKIMAFAANRVEGIQKLLQLQEQNPKLKLSLKPRTELYLQKQAPTDLSQKGFFKLVRQVADLMESDVNDVLDEVSMEGIARIKPKKTYIGAWQFRKGELGDYTTDPTKIYPSLFYKLTKKIYIDKEIRSLALRLNKIGDQNIRKVASDLLDTVSGKFQKQFLPYSLTGKITGIQAQLKLGARISPAIVNMFQRLYAIGTTGEKNFVKASKNIFTPEAQAILKKIGVSTEVPLFEGMGKARAKKWFDPLFLFGQTEGGKYVGNRNSVALSGYYKGLELPFDKINANLAKLKLPVWKNQEDMAIDFARNLVDATQFRYDVSDFAPVIRNNLGKVLFQFKTYGLNQLHNTYNVITGKPLAGLELFFPEGLSKTQAFHQAAVHFGTMFSQGGIKSLGFGLEKFLPAAVLTKLALEAPALLFGVSAFLGIDISSSATVELSNLTSILPGGDAQKVWKAIKNKDPEELLNISPAAYRIYRALEATENGGYLKDIESEMKTIKLKPLEIAEYAVGINPLAISQEQVIHMDKIRTTEEMNTMVSNSKRDLWIAIQNKDFELAQNIVANLKKEGIEIKASDMTEFIKKSEMPRLLRDYENFRKSQREEFGEKILEFYQKR